MKYQLLPVQEQDNVRIKLRSTVNRNPPDLGPRDEWLDTSMQMAWRSLGEDKTRSGVIGICTRHSIDSVRDLLVIGKKRTATIQHVGEVLLDKLMTAVSRPDIALPWEEDPTPEYIASFCSRLSQVHAAALGLGHIGRTMLSVLDILDMPPNERPYVFPESQKRIQQHGYVSPEVLHDMSTVPETFAMRFEHRRHIVQSS